MIATRRDSRAFVALILLVAVFSSLAAPRSARAADVLSGSIGLNAGQYRYYPLYIPEGEIGVLSGRFTASGGGNNDVEVFVIDEDGFVNWRNNHNVATFYNSGKVTTAKVSASLAPGTYYLIVSNAFSFLTAKTVEGRISMELIVSSPLDRDVVNRIINGQPSPPAVEEHKEPEQVPEPTLRPKPRPRRSLPPAPSATPSPTPSATPAPSPTPSVTASGTMTVAIVALLSVIVVLLLVLVILVVQGRRAAGPPPAVDREE